MKKQLAVLMAAATAVTTVAPVVANAATINTSRADALAKVQEALKVRYTDPAVTGLKNVLVTNGNEYLNSVYKFAAKIDGKYVKADGSENKDLTTADVVKDSYRGLSLDDIKSILNYAELHGKEVTIEKFDKGHKVDGNNIFANEYASFQRYTFTDADDQQSIAHMLTKALYIENKVGNDVVGYTAPDYLSSLSYAGNTYTLQIIDKKPVLVLSGVDASKITDKDTLEKILATSPEAVVGLTKNGKRPFDSEKVSGIELSKVLKLNLASGKSIVINENDNFVLNFLAAVDKDGKVHNLFAQNAGNGYANQIVDFGKVETKYGEVSSYDINTKPEAIDTYIVQQYNAVFDVKDIYTVADGYSVKGAEFVNNMIAADKDIKAEIKNGKVVVEGAQFNFNGKRYVVSVKNADVKAAKLVKEGDKAVFYVKASVLALDDVQGMMGTDTKAVYEKITSAVIRVESSSELEASTVQRDIVNKQPVVAKRRNVLAGADRFKTAIEISKEAFEKDGSAGAIVLVGQYSTVDGLAAAPFAKKVNAPILLSQYNKIDADTIAEIKRLIGKNSEKKVYIVGGENTISKDVEKQLIDELNIRSERIEGKDRFETSRRLASKVLDKKTAEKVFVVGAEAEPDAMSASAVAAKFEAPIVVVPKTQLDSASKEYLNGISDKNLTEAYLVGGVNSASEQVRKDLVALTKLEKVKRLAGSDRQETNAEVIKEFYPTNKKAGGLFVAKSDTKSLVDALAAGPLAGKKGFPIVLATNALTDSQKMAVRNSVVNYKTQASIGYANVYEVGMGINSAVMSAIYNILGL